MARRLGIAVSNIPYISIFSTTRSPDSKIMSVNTELIKTRQCLSELSKTKYVDSTEVKSISETSTESMSESSETSESYSDSEKPIEISTESESESSDSFREDLLESKDQSIDDECDKCTEIRCFYRKALSKLREQFEAVSAENRTLIKELHLGSIMDIEDS